MSNSFFRRAHTAFGPYSVQIFSDVAGHAHSSFVGSSFGPPHIETSPGLDEQSWVASTTPQAHTGQSHCWLHEMSTSMEKTFTPNPGGPDGVHTFLQRGSNKQCILGWVGRSLAVQDCLRLMGPVTMGTTHKCVRAEGRPSCPETLPPCSSWEACPHKDRQPLCGLYLSVVCLYYLRLSAIVLFVF